MRIFLNIIILTFYSSIFSQVKIDTSEIESIRNEWRINTKKSDTSLSKTLINYKSGFFKLKLIVPNDSTMFGSLILSKGKYSVVNKKALIYIETFGDGILKAYYDQFENPDSIVLTIYKPEFKKIVTQIDKKYKRKGKLEYISDLDGMNFYHYNLFGKLKRIEQFRDSVLYKVSEFKNGLLISESFPTREKYRKKFTYEYDLKGRIVLKDASDSDFLKYYYNNFGIERIEKIYKKNNRVVEYTIFEYDKNGKLKRKKEFYGKNILRVEYLYDYE